VTSSRSARSRPRDVEARALARGPQTRDALVGRNALGDDEPLSGQKHTLAEARQMDADAQLARAHPDAAVARRAHRAPPFGEDTPGTVSQDRYAQCNAS